MKNNYNIIQRELDIMHVSLISKSHNRNCRTKGLRNSLKKENFHYCEMLMLGIKNVSAGRDL